MLRRIQSGKIKKKRNFEMRFKAEIQIDLFTRIDEHRGALG
jgi:hypothetical protein